MAIGLADALRGLLRDESDRGPGLVTTNDAMVTELMRAGTIRNGDVAAAFSTIDRQHFWPDSHPALVYSDQPLRSGKLHLSAPQIYAEALESLMPLKAGMSFLNVGSGTGYFNSLVSELTGELSTNHGIDIWSETLEHAAERLRALGKRGVEMFLGNVYELNVNQTMRYDRIYLGACANPRSKYLYRLLEVGGVLVGPFQVGRNRQQLRRVVRVTESQFHVRELESVRFAHLVEPSPSSPTSMLFTTRRDTVDEGSIGPLGLPGVRFTFELRERPWTPERALMFPPAYRCVVALAVRGRQCTGAPSFLPGEIWTQHIFPWCPRWWFDSCSRCPSRQCRGHSLPDAMHGALPLVASALPVASCPPIGKFSDEDLSDTDGGSTRAPSSSANTPEIRPLAGAEPPDFSEVFAAETDDVFVEVFGNGMSHAIGADEDPDLPRPDDWEHGHRRFVRNIVDAAVRAGRRRRREEHDEGEQELEGEDLGELPRRARRITMMDEDGPFF